MTTTCSGCSATTTGHGPACPQCVARLPRPLRDSLATVTHQAAEVHQDVASWLADHPRLSERELEVLRLVSNGLRDQEIADTLGRSVNTIRDHLKRVSRRLGCSGRPHLIAVVHRKGYLNEDVCVG